MLDVDNFSSCAITPFLAPNDISLRLNNLIGTLLISVTEGAFTREWILVVGAASRRIAGPEKIKDLKSHFALDTVPRTNKGFSFSSLISVSLHFLVGAANWPPGKKTFAKDFRTTQKIVICESSQRSWTWSEIKSCSLQFVHPNFISVVLRSQRQLDLSLWLNYPGNRMLLTV